MKYKAIILCANQAKKKPLSALTIQGKKHYERVVELLKFFNIDDITIACDQYNSNFFKKKPIYSIELVTSDRCSSLHTLCSVTVDDSIDYILIIDGNILFDYKGIEALLDSTLDNAVIIANYRDFNSSTKVELDNGDISNIYINDVPDVNKEMIGLTKISYDTFIKIKSSYDMGVDDKYENIIINNTNKIQAIYIDDFYWYELSDNYDIKKIENEVIPRLNRSFYGIKIEDEVKKIFEKITFKKVSSISSLGGMTNRNFIINSEEQLFVARIPGEGTQELIDRKTEYYNNNIASRINIDVKPIYFSELSGIKIVPYIINAETLNPDTIKKNIERCLNLLRLLHESEFLFAGMFDIEKEIEKYFLKLENKNFYKDIELLKNKVEKIIVNYKTFDISYVSCHNDLVAENFILSNDDTYIIDWEYSSRNDPLWDLASLILENNFESIDNILSLYFGRKPNEEEKERLNCCIIFQDFLWVLWSIVKCESGVDYYHYGLERFNRLKRNLIKYEIK